MTESNYTQLIKTRNLIKVNNEIVTTHKIMIIAIILLVLLGLTTGLMLFRKMNKVEIRTI